MATGSKLPIILGVTGHRDVRGEPPVVAHAVRAAAEAVIDAFLKAYPGTPIVLLSSIAEGADQLVAEIALARGIRVVAPLPFPAKYYRSSTTFVTQQGREKFKELLGKVEYFVVRLPEHHVPTTRRQWRTRLQEPEFRRGCYTAASVYIAQHSHAMIALWDGLRTTHAAGTFPDLRFKLTGELPRPYPWPRHMFQTADTGPVFVVHTPRSILPPAGTGAQATTDPEEAGAISQWSPIEIPEETTPIAYRAGPGGSRRLGMRSWQTLSLVSAAIRRRFSPKPESQGAPRPAGIFGPGAGLDRPASERAAWLDSRVAGIATCVRLHEFNGEIGAVDFSSVKSTTPPIDLAKYGASSLAIFYQGQVKLFSTLLYLLTGLSLLLLHLYAHAYGPIVHDKPIHYPIYLWGYVALLFVVFLVVLRVWDGELERKWLDFRALAEALRVQSFWMRAGLDAPAASSYLRQVHSDLSWVRRALWASVHAAPAPKIPFAAMSKTEQLGRLKEIGKEWVLGQRNFFSKHRKVHRQNELVHWSAVGLAILGWAVAIYLLLDPRDPDKYALVASGTLVVAAGLLIGYKDHQFLGELARQYERMSVLFHHADLALEQHLGDEDVATCQQLIEDLGREALSENASWLILHRTRPFEVPLG